MPQPSTPPGQLVSQLSTVEQLPNRFPQFTHMPWHLPLEEWPARYIAALPRGISRHIVRFVRAEGTIYAFKEISLHLAEHESNQLRRLRSRKIPAVAPEAVITGRFDGEGKPLDSVLVTRHLEYSLPYRSLFVHDIPTTKASRLMDALAVLLVRLHLKGFFWGDVSLSNTLFRRDAGSLTAYLVDCETGELHPTLTAGQRRHDLSIAHTNVIGELMDLQAGGSLGHEFDALGAGDWLLARYEILWEEITKAEVFAASESWKIQGRITRLNELGFDVGELSVTRSEGSDMIMIKPRVVGASHYSTQIRKLTGMRVEENQARRLMNDIEAFRARHERWGQALNTVASIWLRQEFKPTIDAVPHSLRGKLQPAEIYHEVLEHRWFACQAQNRDVPLSEAVTTYVEQILRHRRDEQTLLLGDRVQGEPGPTTGVNIIPPENLH